MVLSKEAVRILKQVDCDFDLSSDQISSLFRKAREMAGIIGLTFHDSRHAAITQLSSKLGLLELARMVGMKDLKILTVYHNESAEELAKNL